MTDLKVDEFSMTEIMQNSVISAKKNRKRQPMIDDHEIQKCLPECLQLYIHKKQVIDISADLKLIHPDINELFMKYNRIYFDNKLEFCMVQWSETFKSPINMYENSGYCMFLKKICYIYLSKPILQYGSTKEIIETLLHEMIHAFLFIFNQHHHDRSDHGKRFISIMNAINYVSKSIKITIYHYCNQELEMIKLTIFQCNGICQKVIERPNNRPPGKHEKWWNKHEIQCGGTYVKINDLSKTKNEKKSILGKRGRGRNDDNEENEDIVIISSPKKKKRRIDTKQENNNLKQWNCELCTFLNNDTSRKCEICNTERKQIAALDITEDNGDSDIEVLNS